MTMTLTVPKNFTIQVKMTSDWHVGSGSGRGEIDSTVQRDKDNLPYIPAKTLTGILRDGCEQIALALGNNWSHWIDFLFGDQPALAEGAIEKEPRPAVLSVSSASLDSKLREALNHQEKLKSAIAFIKPGVAIDNNTGSANPKALRFEEVVRMGTILQSQNCTLNFENYEITDEQKKIVFTLLLAGTKIIDRLGGKRRRGTGKCEISILENQPKIEPDNWIKWLQQEIENNNQEINKIPDNKQLECEQPESKSKSNYSEAKGDWWTVSLTITTKTPIVIPKRIVGNVVECLDYIPGRYFLRHLHQALGKFIDVDCAIGQGDIVITNATVAINNNAGRPTPFCLFGEKLDGGLSKKQNVYNRFQEAEPDGIQLKGERSGYIGQFNDNELPQYETLKLQLNTHNTINDKYQRPDETVGGVYSYQAIPADTTFKAELRLPESIKEHLEQQSNNWWQELEKPIRIGQSKKDQYGVIEIKVAEPKDFKSKFKKSDEKLLYIWFLSDVLMRDKNLNPTTNPDVFRETLQKELNVTLAEREDDNLLSLMMRSRRTESWQVRWGLPRPSMLGWQAGSCAVYEVTNGEVDPKKLIKLEAKGIGDRRAEGYGQICFNDPLLMAEQLKDKTRFEPTPNESNTQFKLIAHNDPSFDYARTIETAAWREAIETKALTIAADENHRKGILGILITKSEEDENQHKSQPTMSQLGSVRSNLRKLQSQSNIPAMLNWIQGLQSKRQDKWEKTDNGLHKLSQLVTQPQEIWQIFSCFKLDLESLVITQDGKTQLQNELWAEAVRTLVYAIIRAHKRDLEKLQKETN